jgi:hypothetical protein
MVMMFVGGVVLLFDDYSQLNNYKGLGYFITKHAFENRHFRCGGVGT